MRSGSAPPASAPPAPAASAADPRALVRVLEDPNADASQRKAGFEQLKSMGPAARPAVPALCKLLNRRESSPVGHTSFGRDVAALLGSIGPEAAKAAVATMRTEMTANPPVGDWRIYWNGVAESLGAAAHPALADALADKCDPLAELAARHLAHGLGKEPPNSLTKSAVATVTPKLAPAWQRAMNASFDYDSKRLSELSPDQRRQRWIDDLHIIATAAGPKAVDALVAAAEGAGKEKRSDPVAAAAAVKEYARFIKDPAVKGGYGEAQQKVLAFGGAAIAPLAEMFLSDPSFRKQALGLITSIIEKSMIAAEGDPALARQRLLRGEPPPVLPLDARNRAALAKIAPELGKLVDQIRPGGGAAGEVALDQHTETGRHALMLLQRLTPEVPAAAKALVARLDRLPKDHGPYTAAVLSRADKTVLKKIEAAAARGNPIAQDTVRLARLRTLPPQEAAADILANVPPDARREFVNRLIHGTPAATAVPLLIELLVDPRSGADDMLKHFGPRAVPALVAGLDRPEPQIRAAVLMTLPPEAVTPDVARKAATMLDEDELAQPVRHVLTLAGSRSLPLLVEQTRSDNPVARRNAAATLHLFASDTRFEKFTDEHRGTAGAALAALLDDADDSVRTAALNTSAWFPKAFRPTLAARLKDSTPQQRQRLAQALVEAGSPTTGWPSMDGLIEQVKKPLDQGGGYEWNPNRGSHHLPGLVVSSLVLEPDAAVAAAAEDVLIRADVAALDRSIAQRQPTTQEAAVIAKASSDPDPQARIAAVGEAASLRPSTAVVDLVFAALADKDVGVRTAALQAINLLMVHPTPRLPQAVATLIELAERDRAWEVRHAAQQALDGLQRDRMYEVRARVRFLARSDDERDRAVAAAVLRVLHDPSGERLATDAPPREVAILLKLVADPAPAVRSVATVSLARYVRFDAPKSHAAKALVKLLDNLAALDLAAKAAVLSVVPDLAAAGEPRDQHADADVKAAALLGIEQPPNTPPLADRRVPVAVATAALASPSQRVRRMAAHSLTFADPADATRQAKGAAALLKATNDPNDEIAIDALDVIADSFCGGRVGPGETVWRQYPGFGEVGRTPTGFEVQMRRLMERTQKGTVAERIGAINEIGASGEPKMLAARWDAYIRLLRDPDPQIRAAAFAVARTLTAAAIARYQATLAAGGVAAPAPAAAPTQPQRAAPPARRRASPAPGSGAK